MKIESHLEEDYLVPSIRVGMIDIEVTIFLMPFMR